MTSKDIDTLLIKELDDIAATMGYVDDARAMLEDAFSAPCLPKRNRQVVWAASTAAAMAAAAAVLFVLLQPGTLEVSIGNDGRTLSVGSWVSSPMDTGLLLSFSDGSAVDLTQNSEVRLQALKNEGAHLLLERGRVAVSVVHRATTEWRLDAGPYKVSVTGTRFSVHWIPEIKAFSADVQDGTIIVEGPMLADGKSLSAGDNLHVSLLNKVVEIFKKDTYERIVSSDQADTDSSILSADEAVLETEGTPVETEILETAALSETALPPEARSKDGRGSLSIGESWKSLAVKGAWSASIQTAERAGIKTIISSASVSDILLLGDAARLAKNYSRAMQVYKTVRTRFPGTSEAQRAAFMMGRIEFEAHGKYADAAQWFKACFGDNARGAMAREAYGRLVEALDKAGDSRGARDAATQYLGTYRNGPHARLAKQILSK